MVPVRQERNFNSNRDTEQVLLEKHFEVHASLCPGSEGFRVNEDFFASLLERHRLAVESFTTAPDSGAFRGCSTGWRITAGPHSASDVENLNSRVLLEPVDVELHTDA